MTDRRSPLHLPDRERLIHGPINRKDIRRAEMAAAQAAAETPVTPVASHFYTMTASGVYVYDTLAGTWTLKAQSGTGGGHGYTRGCVRNNKLHLVAGLKLSPNGYTTVNERYDPVANTFTALAPFPTSPTDPASSAWYQDKLHVIGGDTSTTAAIKAHRVYDPATDSWSTAAAYPIAYWWGTMIELGDYLYRFGGHSTGVVTNAVYRYSAATDAWTAMANLPIAMGQQGVAVLNGVAYLVGGSTPSARSEVWRYDPTADTYLARAGLPTARQMPGVAALDGAIYSAGDNVGVTFPLYRYDPLTNVWSTLASCPVACGSWVGAALNPAG